MGNNHKEASTVTRSISFKCDTIAATDERVGALRTDRSSFVNDVLEHVLGIFPHPECVGNHVPFIQDIKQGWKEQALAFERAARGISAPKVKPGQLVRRPGSVLGLMRKTHPTR